MKCNYCGMEVSENQMFCWHCGTRQTPAAQPKEVRQPEVKDEPRQDEYGFEAFAQGQALPAHPAWEPEAAPRPEPQIQQPPVSQPMYVLSTAAPAPESPRIQLPTGRSLAKMFFLGILTLGIYPAVIWSRIVTELNLAASRYDGERTMPYFAMVVLSPFTLFIYTLVWIHGFCRRIGAELSRRGFSYKFGASTFWLWNVLGSLILVGPFVFLHKLMKSMNFINTDFNIHG